MAEVTTKNLKRVLGKKDLAFIAIGQVIGAGIFSMLPTAIGLTGRAASLAFIMASILTLLVITPRFFVMGTIRMRGGNYTYVSLFGGQKIGGAYLIVHILMNIAISMYGLSVAQYLCSAIDGLNVTVVGVIVLTVMYVINLVGVKSAARVQGVLVVCLLLAIAVFCAFGIIRVDPAAYLDTDGFFQNGAMSFLSAAALLTFATSGAQTIVNFSAEAKNPTKDMPPVIIGVTVGVALVYAFMAVVASGVLPVELVGGQPLTLVAAEILPGPLYAFFIVGGAVFAILTTLNSQFGWATKPLLQGCADGWFPKWLGAVNDRFKTPHVLLTLFYLVGVIPLIFGIDMDTLSGTSVFSSSVVDIMLAACLFRLPKIIPEEWKKSKWHVSDTALKVWTVIGVLAAGFSAYMSLYTLEPLEMAANIVVVVIALAFGFLVDKFGHVNAEISYESE